MTDTPQDSVANLTLMHLRRLDSGQARILEILQRHETQLGRIQRDLAELKSDQYTLDSQMLNRMNEILRVIERLDEHETRLQRLELQAQGE
jgi:hypothetical protein